MYMSNSEREAFANEVICEIFKSISHLDIKGCYVMTELKRFASVAGFSKLKNTTGEKAIEVELLGRHFTKEEAYDICQSISENLYHRCTIADCMGWPFDMWYAMVEMLKIFGIGPSKNFTSFVNFFFIVNIDIKDDLDCSDEVNRIMKKLKIIRLLGQPENSIFKPKHSKWPNEPNLF